MDLRDIKEFLKDALKYIIAIAVILIVAIYVVSFQEVIGPSMNNTLKSGDITVVNKLVFRLRNIKRNEIVSLKKDDKIMVKRIIGLPGEHIEYKDNILYVDGKKISDSRSSSTKDFKLESIGYDTIPKDMYLVLGDNRTNSSDSRTFGLVKKSDIIGKVNIRIYPFNKIKIF
ncbi:signal peptidase I [Firmicutes bacterium CAG:582]|jgi:signal peptidase I|nr:signal peptidase I [Firmicutes bacterium CAG:582]